MKILACWKFTDVNHRNLIHLSKLLKPYCLFLHENLLKKHLKLLFISLIISARRRMERSKRFSKKKSYSKGWSKSSLISLLRNGFPFVSKANAGMRAASKLSMFEKVIARIMTFPLSNVILILPSSLTLFSSLCINNS